MKSIAKVEYKKVGDDGYYAEITTNFHQSRVVTTEFFAEQFEVLLDRVLFFMQEIKK